MTALSEIRPVRCVAATLVDRETAPRQGSKEPRRLAGVHP